MENAQQYNYLNLDKGHNVDYYLGKRPDSRGQYGPTLQSIADQAKYQRQKREVLESIFDVVAPLGLTSTEVEAASGPMKEAGRLANLFTDWFSRGTPTIAVPKDAWKSILKSGKFKNQMELTQQPKAWDKRLEVEKQLAGIPKTPRYNAKEARKHPVYGHIYHPDYNDINAAHYFGDTYAEMSQKVKDRSRYVLGDSFDTFINRSFSSDDMLGKSSALERSLFNLAKGAEDGRVSSQRIVEALSKKQMDYAGLPYMEMWIPNELSTINNINSIYLPGRSLSRQQIQRNPNELLNKIEHPQKDFLRSKEYDPYANYDLVPDDDIGIPWDAGFKPPEPPWEPTDEDWLDLPF